jgi:YHS domain-containing protein
MRLKKDTAPLTDPVCGMTVHPKTANAQTCYNGHQIYFCSQGCLQAFLSSPENYRLSKKKGIWARYLERLNKVMAANPPSCHG